MILSLKSMVVMCGLVSLLGVAAVVGLKTLTFRENAGPVEAETTYGPIKLTVRLDKNTFRLGEKINATVTITNISNETIRLQYTQPPNVDFAVYNSSLQIISIYSHTYGFISVLGGMNLEPWEAYSRTLQWDQQKGECSRQPVSTGTYFITGRTGPTLYYLGPKDEWHLDYEYKEFITVETPKIEVEIT